MKGQGKPAMTDRDLIAMTMQEVQRLSAEHVGPNPLKSEPAMTVLREVLDHNKEKQTMTDQSDSQWPV